jgi:hypothetical protein
MEKSIFPEIDNFKEYLVKTYASIMIIIVLTLLIKLKFKLDIGAILILFGYTISMIFRIQLLSD